MRKSVSVVIPAHDASRFLDACLAHLAASTVAPFECIVVDDGSTDDTADVARRHGASVVATGWRSGPALARNLVRARGILVRYYHSFFQRTTRRRFMPHVWSRP